MYLRTNSKFCAIQHFHNRGGKCLLRGRNLVFNWNWICFVLKGLNLVWSKIGDVRKTWNSSVLEQPLFPWKRDEYYIFWMCVRSLNYPACNAHVPNCHLQSARLYNIFHIISQTAWFSGGGGVELTVCVLISSTTSVWTYLITPWCRVLLEKLIGLQLVKKFPAFHGIRRFITALTSVRHLSLSWATQIQSIYPHPTSWRSILILSTHLYLANSLAAAVRYPALYRLLTFHLSLYVARCFS